jgi:hypothetical protein
MKTTFNLIATTLVLLGLVATPPTFASSNYGVIQLS